MRMATFEPSASLSDAVRTFTVVQTEDEIERALLPDTGLVVGFRFRGSATLIEAETSRLLPQTALTGLRDTTRRMQTSAGGGVVLATFRDAAAAEFIREPLHELFGSTVALGDLFAQRDVDEATARLADATQDVARIAVVEQFLAARRFGTRDALVAAAVRKIRETRGGMKIRALAAELGISQARLEKRFRAAVGASPKRFASILRLRQAVDAYRSGANLARVALDAGYYDQPHFIREFRAITGEAPQRFFSRQTHC